MHLGATRCAIFYLTYIRDLGGAARSSNERRRILRKRIGDLGGAGRSSNERYNITLSLYEM